MSKIDDFYKNTNIIRSSFAEQTFAKFQNQLAQMHNPIFDRTLEMQNQYDAIAATAASEMAEKISSSFLLPFSEILANQNYQQQIISIQNSINHFASSVTSMNIHPNYVSIPESLIPEDFTFEEIAENSMDDSSEFAETKSSVKRLSFSDALTVIGILISLLSLLQSSLPSPQLEELKKQTEYVIAIYNEIQEIECEHLKTDVPALSVESGTPSDASTQPVNVDFDTSNSIE